MATTRNLEQIRNAGYMCVGRAVFFAAIAIVTTMTGCAFDPALAFRMGAFLTLALAAALIWKSQRTHIQSPKTTEVWLHLDEDARPREEAAILAFGDTMRGIYVQFAWHAFLVSTGFFALSLAFSLMNV